MIKKITVAAAIATSSIFGILSAGSAHGSSLFWAINQFRTVEQLDGDTGAVVNSFDVPVGFGSAASIAVVGNTGYYTLLENANVYKVDITSKTSGGIAFNIGDSNLANGITVDSAGHLWFANGGSSPLREFDIAGNLLSTHAFPDSANSYRDGSVVYDGFVVANRGDQTGPFDRYAIPAGANAPLMYVNKPFIVDPVQNSGNNGIAFNGTNFYISNEQLHQVCKYDANGVFNSCAPLDRNSRYENWTFASQDIIPPGGSTAVPEPFTIVGTLIGATVAFRTRQRLKATNKL